MEDFPRKNSRGKAGRRSQCRDCYNELRRLAHDTRSASPDYVARRRNSSYLTKYGITTEDYERMLDAQGGGCAACGARPGKRRLHVDHDHACCPGRTSCGRCIRGLLCHGCNNALGCVKDDPELLVRLAAYLTSRPTERA